MPSALFIHNGTPGRFEFIARGLLQKGWRLVLINGQGGNELTDVPTHRFKLKRAFTPGIFPPVKQLEKDFIFGRATAEVATKLKAQGFAPDVIVGHPGWGEMLFLSEVFPDARQIQVGEYYYHSRGADVGFDPEFGPVEFGTKIRVHARNATLALSHMSATRIVSATPFQASMLPAVFQERVRVIHEGIDTAVARPNPHAVLSFKNGLRLDRTVPVVTFVNRILEPMRGFHVLMRSLPRLLAGLPSAHVMVVGADGAGGYGRQPPDGTTWKEYLLAELRGRFDASRVHFVGQTHYKLLIDILSVSAAHIYLTYPFVLSWSLLDAMACECLVIGSDTAPVRDVIRPGVNGLLVDFFDTNRLADQIVEVCRKPQAYAPLRTAARRTVVSGYDRETKCLPAWLNLIDEVLQDTHALRA